MNFLNTLFKLKEFVEQKKITTPIILGSIIIILALFFLFYKLLNPSLNTQNLSDYSKIIPGKATNYFVIQKDDGYIYKSSKTGLDAVKDFINKNPSFRGVRLLPSNFAKNSDLTRSEKDSEDKFLKSKNIDISNEHYFFEQKINGIPVYGSSLVVHLRNKNEIYSVSGNLVNTKTTTEQKITEDEARSIVLALSKEEEPEIKSFVYHPAQKIIFNKSIVGIDKDTTNYLALLIQVDSNDLSHIFSKRYVLELVKGEIIYEQDLTPDIKDRVVYNCNDTPSSCTVSRTEGSSPSGDQEVDRSYDILGQVYDYYFNTFGRDSFDNRGSSMKAYVHKIILKGQQNICPNAQYSSGTMYYCTGTVILDITAHEFTHGVTASTAQLVYSNQSGALNESISDIFGSNLDNNWTMGEGSIRGIIRDMSDPPRIRDSLGYYPDKLFSQNYYCGGADSGGVHHNSSIMNKTFYLMTDGGNFNGCSINGIGREKSSAVVYQALTKYLTSNSNFKSMYNSMLQACNDLYSSGSSDCESVKSALQATEMDQQPDGSQIGAYCQNISPRTPVCAGGAPIPTDSVTPIVTSNPAFSPAPSITSMPQKYKISITVWTDINNNDGGQPDDGDIPYQGATVTLKGPINLNGVTDNLGKLAFQNLTPGNYSLKVVVPGFNIPSIPVLIDSNDLNFALPLPSMPPLTPPIIITQPITPTPSIPISTPIPTTRPGVSPTPTPTPIVIFNCKIDPECALEQKNLHFCSLICTPK